MCPALGIISFHSEDVARESGKLPKAFVPVGVARRPDFWDACLLAKVSLLLFNHHGCSVILWVVVMGYSRDRAAMCIAASRRVLRNSRGDRSRG